MTTLALATRLQSAFSDDLTASVAQKIRSDLRAEAAARGLRCAESRLYATAAAYLLYAWTLDRSKGDLTSAIIDNVKRSTESLCFVLLPGFFPSMIEFFGELSRSFGVAVANNVSELRKALSAGYRFVVVLEYDDISVSQGQPMTAYPTFIFDAEKNLSVRSHESVFTRANPEGSSRRACSSSPRGCRSWWSKRPRDPAAPGSSGYRSLSPPGGWRNCASGYAPWPA